MSSMVRDVRSERIFSQIASHLQGGRQMAGTRCDECGGSDGVHQSGCHTENNYRVNRTSLLDQLAIESRDEISVVDDTPQETVKTSVMDETTALASIWSTLGRFQQSARSRMINWLENKSDSTP